MESHLDEVVAPASNDLVGWRQAIVDGRYRHFRCENLVAAIQDLGPSTDKAVLNPLAKQLSDCMLHMLRGMVGRNHRNHGDDIIEDVHARLWAALLQPTSADGRGLRIAFGPRVKFRVKDALVREARSRMQSLPEEPMGSSGLEGDSDATSTLHDQSVTVFTEPEQAVDQAEVNEVLETIADWRKRLAFQLYMDGVPFKSIRVDSIAKAVGINERTAREWIKEIQQILKMHMGDMS